MKLTNITWDTKDEQKLETLPKEIHIPKRLIQFICHKNEIYPDYNFLMGYNTGIPKKWWYGIEDITFIFMGAWNDPYVGYKDYAINTHTVEDAMWDMYNEDYPAPSFTSPEYQTYEQNFTKYMQDNREDVFNLLDCIIETTRNNMADYAAEITGIRPKAFAVNA